MQHLSLDNARSLQYLDKSSSKWITHLRSSPAIPVTKDSMLHLKDRDVTILFIREDKINIKQEDAEQAMHTAASLEKRKMDAIVIDLTYDEDCTEKRNKLNNAMASSPLRRFAKGMDEEVRYLPG